jgi:hypothetical protein
LVYYFTKWNSTSCKIFGKKVFILYFGFWSQEAKRTKKPKNSYPHYEKFGILDETKRTHKNFGILHFIIPK